MNRKIYVLFGPPGSGKGTQAEALAAKLKIPIIATGDLLRTEQAKDTELGKEVGKYMKAGKLVPDNIIHDLIVVRMRKLDAKLGFILDGYPRDAKQLNDLLTKIKPRDGLVFVEIKVSDKEVLNRLGGRRVCACGMTYHLLYNPPKKAGFCDACGKKLHIREDDKPAVIKDRLLKYHSAAKPIAEYAKEHNLLISLDGQKSIEAVRRDLFKALSLLID